MAETLASQPGALLTRREQLGESLWAAAQVVAACPGIVWTTTVCSFLVCDLRHHHWWPSMQEAVGIASDQLPEMTLPGAVVGRLSPPTAEALGLASQTLVVNGGMDQAAGAIGAGSINSQAVSETTGAALAIQVTTPHTRIWARATGFRLASTTCGGYNYCSRCC